MLAPRLFNPLTVQFLWTQASFHAFGYVRRITEDASEVEGSTSTEQSIRDTAEHPARRTPNATARLSIYLSGSLALRIFVVPESTKKISIEPILLVHRLWRIQEHFKSLSHTHGQVSQVHLP